MAKRMPKATGQLPRVTAALFCDQVLMGQDAVPTLVRVVDRLNVTGAEARMPKTVFETNIFVRFVADKAKGKYGVSMALRSPNGNKVSLTDKPVQINFADPLQQVTLQVQCVMGIEKEGGYWIDILVGRTIVARMPLTVRYHRDPSIAAEKPGNKRARSSAKSPKRKK